MSQEVDTRPVNLALTKLKFPLPALVSITHRLSGIGLFLGSLYLLFLLVVSLTSEQAFVEIAFLLSLNIHKFIVWGILTIALFHFFAGVRHLLLDLHIGTSLHRARQSAQLVIGLSVLSFIFSGIWLFV